uniref:RING-type domain-containing protein n=1 Tax=Leersia perrieri TaxID=77586 RepID=A0A0D9VJ92_9ORYZ
MEAKNLWALYVGVASLAIGMLGVLGVWLCYLFQAVARGPPPDPPPPPCTPETEEDDKNGLTKEELRNLGGILELEEVGDGVEEEEEEETLLCPICLDGMEAGRAVRFLPGCNRSFHQDCVDRWLAISPRCPVCNVWVTTPQSTGTSPPPAAKPALDS